MNLEIPGEQYEQALDAVAQELLDEAGIDRPPIDSVVVAQRLGLIVAVAGAMAGRARLVRTGPRRQPVIYLSDEPRPQRRYWAVAHELGEWAAYRVFQRLGVPRVDLHATARETTANRLAGRLLLPRQWFVAEGIACQWDLLELKQVFATASHELIARRMLECRESMLVTVFDQGRLTWRAANRLTWTPPIAACELEVHRAMASRRQPTQADPSRLPGEFVAVRGWPVDEPAWQRDILCAELAEP